MAQLWPHFESWGLFEPTVGSTDVVHLIKYASQFSGWLLKASVGLQPKGTIVGEDRQFWVIFAISDFHKMISSQGFGIVYHLNGLSGNTNIR